MQSILVVEDEQDLVELLQFNLRAAGFDVQVAQNGADALIAASERTLDLVLLDLMLPDLPGTEVCRKLKASPRTRGIPVIMVTARGEEVDRVVGFELGADDFVTKPFSMRELLLRVKAVLRRGPGGNDAEQPRTAVGEVRIDLDSHRAYVGGAEVDLTALEFKLLHNFMARAGRLQTRETLLRDVWGISSNLQTRTVDTHVKRLREKLGDGREMIETVRGAGYRMVDPQEA
ncbi:MAG TPA: response regulator transcription factor [Myxococcales bacterium]|nr:response regulator transcription factor [Myxococcales bacterium]